MGLCFPDGRQSPFSNVIGLEANLVFDEQIAYNSNYKRPYRKMIT